MDKQEAKKSALKILNESHIGTMATVESNKPNSRYMTFFNDEFTLYTGTSRKTHKAEELKANPYTHILLGYDGDGFGDMYVEVSGTVTEAESEGLKEKMWNDELGKYFDGPEDPDFLLLKITPTHIRVMNKRGEEPVTIEM